MYNKILNIVFFGEDAFSNVILTSLIEAGHSVRLVVTPKYNNFIYKRLEGTCKKWGIEFYRAEKVNSPETAEIVWQAKPDLCVIAHFERLIKADLLSIPPMGFINLHPSLLPDYRGMAPQHWPIINREHEAGITVHFVDETADTGDIIIQRRFPINEDMYVTDLQKIWLENYKTIMVEAINAILSQKPVFHQKELSGRYYGKLRIEDCIINKHGSVFDAYALIRGVSLPYYGARMDEMIIYKAHILSPNEDVGGKDVLRFVDGQLVIEQSKKII